MISIFLLICIVVNAQTEPEVELLENDVAILNYYNNNGDLIQSLIIENYSQSEDIELTGGNPIEDFGDEDLLDVISFPKPEKGIQPTEYCYNPTNHKYYIYGGNKILVYNSLNNEFITSINIGERVDHQIYLYPNIKPIIHTESTNKIICTTPDNTVVIIDGSTDIVENTFDLGTYYERVFRSVYKDNYSNNFFVSMEVFSGDEHDYSKILKLSSNGVLLSEYTYDFRIFDLESVANNKLYISSDMGIYKINPNDLSDFLLLESGYFTDMAYATNENKIFACNASTTNIVVLDILNELNTSYIENAFIYGYDAAYNPIDSKIYFVGRRTDGAYATLSVGIENENVVGGSSLGLPMGILWADFNGTNSGVFTRGINDSNFPFGRLYFRYGALDNTVNNSLYQNYGVGISIGYNPDMNQVISLNTSSGFFHIQTNTLSSLIQTEHTGGYCNQSAYNPINDKIYIIDGRLNDELARLSIYNGTDYSLIEEFDIGNHALSLHYCEVNNKVYILRFSGGIAAIDGDDNSVEILSLGTANPRKMLESNENYLVAGAGGAVHRLISFNLQTNYRYDLDISTGTPRNMVWGEANSIAYLNTGDHLVKATVPFTENWNIGKDNSDFLLFSTYDTTVFTKINDNITKIDGINGDILLSEPLKDYSIKEAIYYPKDNTMVLLCHKLNKDYLWKLDCSNLVSLMDPVELPLGQYKSLFLNTNNDRLYVYCTLSASDWRSKVLSVNPSSLALLGSTNLGVQKSLTERTGLQPSPSMLKISLNTNTNQLILPNWTYSNFSVVQCPEEQRSFNKGWNWVSFPKLERNDDDPVDLAPLLNTLEPMPDNMLVQHRLNTATNPMTWAEYNNNTGLWTYNNLDELQSTKGYKIEITDGNDEFQLITPGTRLEPDYPMMLKGNMVENWIGYYEYQTADPFDALAYCIDNLRWIKGQYWSAHYEVIAIDKGAPVYGWIMSRPHPLQYGDMLIVQGIDDCELTWNKRPKTIGKGKAEASYFEFEEQADYTSVFIELDENTQANEIGAFVGESCVGATVVEEGDTLVEIQTYLQGVEGDEMNFVTYTANKSTNGVKEDYCVRDFENMQYVNRKIRPYDQKPFHFISFKDKAIESKEKMLVYHFPNPATEDINIHFNLIADEKVSIELMDINGKVLDKLELGKHSKGMHQYQYALPMNLSSGVYLYKFITQQSTIVNQLIIQ